MRRKMVPRRRETIVGASPARDHDRIDESAGYDPRTQGCQPPPGAHRVGAQCARTTSLLEHSAANRRSRPRREWGDDLGDNSITVRNVRLATLTGIADRLIHRQRQIGRKLLLAYMPLCTC